MVLYSIQDKTKDSFLRNGVIIDTSVILEIMRGVVSTQRKSTDTTGWKAEYEKIITLLELLRINDWKKFFLTPHILTETCSRINMDYNKDDDFEDVAKKIVSIVESSEEHHVLKKEFLGCVAYQANMKLEPGDLSIYALADNFAKEKKKVAILANDEGFSSRYRTNPYIMVIDCRMVSV